MNIRHQDQETKLLNISPRRLREGGAAILQALNKNHHIAILGIKLIRPLLTKRLPSFKMHGALPALPLYIFGAVLKLKISFTFILLLSHTVLQFS